VLCPHCEADNFEASHFCAHCGVALPPPPPPAPSVIPKPDGTHHKHLLKELGSRINEFTDAPPLEDFSLRKLFSEVFKRRTPQEIEDYMTVGTTCTTPDLRDVSTGWPRPWFFARVLGFVTVIYLLFLFALPYFGNPRFIPGFIMLGSMAVPLATLVLFFELNTPRNISIMSLVQLVILGGILGLIAASVVFGLRILNWMGPPSAGIIEEVAKLVTVIIVCRQAKHGYILNGLVFGAAVGTGFAVFESAGYAQDTLLAGLAQAKNWDAFFDRGGAGLLNQEIFLRGWLSPFGHVVWTAIAAGALWRVKQDAPFKFRMLDRTFWKTFLVPVVCHMIWDSRLAMGAKSPSLLNFGMTLVLGAISWVVAFGLVQQGLKQVRTLQLQLAARESRRSVPAVAGA
jgi:protease PrsW